MTFKSFLLLSSATLLFTAAAFAGPVNTGTSGSGLVALGAQDNNFLLFPSTCCGSGLNVNAFSQTLLNDGAYSGAPALVNTATAEWIGYTGFGPYWANGSNATAGFRETFNLTADDIAAGNLNLSGSLGFTGDYVDIQLNNTNDTADTFATDYGAALHSFDISSGFVVGLNTLTFVESWSVADGTAHGNSTTAVMVDNLQLSGGATPEPGTFALMAGSALAVAFLRRRFAR